MVLLRTKLLTLRQPGGGEVEVGPAHVLDSMLNAINRDVDRRRAQSLVEKVSAQARALANHDFGAVAPHLRASLLAFQNMSADEITFLNEQIRAILEDQQNVGLSSHGVGDVAAELLFVEGMIAVADMLDALFLEDILGRVQQALAENVFRRDRIPALGLRHLRDQRPHRLVDGAVSWHAPAEGAPVAFAAGDLVGAGGGEEDALPLIDLFAHRQGRR